MTRFCSHEIGVAKPDPRSYLLALPGSAAPPGQVALVDDVPEFVAGARTAGLHSVLHQIRAADSRRNQCAFPS
jgi:putative hydrolase of the HAD superfamily